METSARTGENIDELFTEICRILYILVFANDLFCLMADVYIA